MAINTKRREILQLFRNIEGIAKRLPPTNRIHNPRQNSMKIIVSIPVRNFGDFSM